MKRPSVPAVLMLTHVGFGVPGAHRARRRRSPRKPGPIIAQPAQDTRGARRGADRRHGHASAIPTLRAVLCAVAGTLRRAWIFIGDAHFNQQPFGLLGTWDSRSVTDGAYAPPCACGETGRQLPSTATRVVCWSPTPGRSSHPRRSFPPTRPEPLPTDRRVTPTSTVAVPTTAKRATPTPGARRRNQRPRRILPDRAGGQPSQPGASAGSITDQLFSRQRLLHREEGGDLHAGRVCLDRRVLRREGASGLAVAEDTVPEANHA